MTRWLSVQELAKHLGISLETVYRLVTNKESFFPCHRIGKLWKFDASEVDAWVKKNKTKGKKAK